MASEPNVKPVGELIGAGWRILFVRRPDRIAHRIELAIGDDYEPLLESLEGSPDERWPASPPLQQVHFQQGSGGGQAALLVGMAGRSHWSAAIAAAGDGRQAVFEIACRASEPPAWLGTSYRCVGPSPIAIAGGRLAIGPLELVLGGVEAARCAKVAVSLRETHLAERDAYDQLSDGNSPLSGEAAAAHDEAPDVLRMSVRHDANRWPQTVSWRYVLQCRA